MHWTDTQPPRAGGGYPLRVWGLAGSGSGQSQELAQANNGAEGAVFTEQATSSGGIGSTRTRPGGRVVDGGRSSFELLFGELAPAGSDGARTRVKCLLDGGPAGSNPGPQEELRGHLINWKKLPLLTVSARGRYEPKNVLVVEDDADDVELLLIAARTAPEAVSFHIVKDGEEAMAYLKGTGQFTDRQAYPFPDLILLDLSLPRIDGFEVLTWIREQPEFSGIQVFVWTDSGDPRTLDRAIRAGASRFVPKSVSFVRGGLAGVVRGISEAITGPAEQDSP